MSDAASPPAARRRPVWVRAALLGLTLSVLTGVCLLVALVPPTENSVYPKCASYKYLGIHCPGCGMTRAAHALFNGHVEQAVAYNPLLVVLAPYFLAAWLRDRWFWLWGTKPRWKMFPPRLSWVIVGVLMVYWVLRNIPVEPFTLLAPHELSP